jgi:hypothetical protein
MDQAFTLIGRDGRKVVQENLERIEESQRQLRDNIETSRRLTEEARALVEQAHKEPHDLRRGR